jgi:hypothetical protein
MAVNEGVIPDVSRELTNNIMKTGYAYRIPELRLKKRVEKGLPPLPEANLEDVSNLFDALSVSKASRMKRK